MECRRQLVPPRPSLETIRKVSAGPSAAEAYRALLESILEGHAAGNALIIHRPSGNLTVRLHVSRPGGPPAPVRWDLVRSVWKHETLLVTTSRGRGPGARVEQLFCVPIRLNGQGIAGLLYLRLEGEPAERPEAELPFLETCAGLLGMILRTERLSEENRRQRSELERVRRRIELLREEGPEAEPLPCRENASPSRPLDAARTEHLRETFPEIVASSPSMIAVLDMVEQFARTDLSILIQGESGTGKELVARAIHRRSKRSGGSFVSENCGACPDNLLESEFFGYERGAFTGADRPKPGLLELAGNGTLFLDEIGEMNLGLQKKLLRVLQEREIRRLGGNRRFRVDFRLVSASNRLLEELVAKGIFREDLFYRLNVVTIHVPALRERKQDIPLLVERFLREMVEEGIITPVAISEQALDVLTAYDWPGNVRELRNEIHRAAVLSVREIEPSALCPSLLQTARRGRSLNRQVVRYGKTLPEVERELMGTLIRDVLARTRGNKARAARLLGIPKTTLYHRLRKYGIERFAPAPALHHAR